MALNADIIFAKNDLEEFCQKEKIDFFHYDSFNDVIEIFSNWQHLKNSN